MQSKEEGQDQESLQSNTNTIWVSDKNTKHHTKESQEASPFQAGNHRQLIEATVKHK